MIERPQPSFQIFERPATSRITLADLQKVRIHFMSLSGHAEHNYLRLVSPSIQISPGNLEFRSALVEFGPFKLSLCNVNLDMLFLRPCFPPSTFVVYYMLDGLGRARALDFNSRSELHPGGFESLCIWASGPSAVTLLDSLNPESGSPQRGVEQLHKLLPVVSTGMQPLELVVEPEVVINWLACLKQDGRSVQRVPTSGLTEQLLELAHNSRSRRVDKFARRLNVSPRTLHLHTVNSFRVGPNRLLKSFALAQFVLQLPQILKSGGTIGDVAWRCGFENFAQFSSDFRAHYGMTASEALRRLEPDRLGTVDFSEA